MLRFFPFFLSMFLACLAAFAQSSGPTLQSISPTGGIRGTTLQLLLNGRNLDGEKRQVVFHELHCTCNDKALPTDIRPVELVCLADQDTFEIRPVVGAISECLNASKKFR